MSSISSKNKWSKVSIYCLIGILVAFLTLSFVHLGSFNMISNNYSFSVWKEEGVESVVFNTDSKNELSEVWFYLTTPNMTCVSSNVEEEQTITATFHYASSKNGTYYNPTNNTIAIDNAISSAGKWYSISDLSVSSSYRYFELAIDAPCKVGEVVFIDSTNAIMNTTISNAGLALDFKPANSYSHSNYATNEDKIKLASSLIDEQSKFNYNNIVLDENGSRVYKVDNLSKFYEMEVPILDTVLSFVNGGNYISPLTNPLGYELLSLPVLIFGANTFALRILPVLFFALSIFAMYLIGKLLFKNPMLGVISAFVYAISGYALSMATILSIDTMFICFALFSFYYIMRFFMRGINTDFPAKGYLNIVLSGVFFALSFAVSTKAIYFLIVYAIIFVAGVIRQYLAYRNRKQKILEDYKDLTEEKLNAKIKTNRDNYVNKFATTLVLFIACALLLTAIIVFVCGVISYKLLGATYTAQNGNIFAQIIAHIKSLFNVNYVTSFDAVNKYNPLFYIINYGAQTIGEGKYAFGNIVTTIVGIVALICSIVYIIISYAKKEKTEKSNFILLIVAFLVAYLMNKFTFTFGIGDYALASAFMSLIIVYAYTILAQKFSKAYIIGLILLGLATVNFALLVSGLLAFGLSKNLYSFNTLGKKI